MSESATTMLEVLQSGKSIEEIIQTNIDKMGNNAAGDSTKTNTLNDKNEKPKIDDGQIKTKTPQDPSDTKKEKREAN